MATALVAGTIPRTRTAARSTFYVAAALLIVAIARIPFSETELWQSFARALLVPLV